MPQNQSAGRSLPGPADPGPADGGPGPFGDDLFAFTDEQPSVCWMREGRGMVGWGVAASERFRGAHRFTQAQSWFTRWSRQPRGDPRERSEPDAPKAEPIAFGSFSFDDHHGESEVIVPERLLRVTESGAELLRVHADRRVERVPLPPGSPDAANREASPGWASMPGVRWERGPERRRAWTAAVATAVERILSGELDKVVLARDVRADFDRPVDLRPILSRLAAAYPQCWTFHVAGLLGATPELLVRKVGTAVTSRVLAGTARTGASEAAAAMGARHLLESAKDLAEHRFAVQSVTAALAAHCADFAVDADPFVLRLANVQHLATDVRAAATDSSGVLHLAAALHPSAAVCGTPSGRALELIASLELIDRGRYSGPVGWFDADGNGEMGIALRCAQLDDSHRSARMFAGCGLVAGSDPGAELAESRAKLETMSMALSPDREA